MMILENMENVDEQNEKKNQIPEIIIANILLYSLSNFYLCIFIRM